MSRKFLPSPLRLTNDLKINTGGKYSRVVLKNTDTFFFPFFLYNFSASNPDLFSSQNNAVVLYL